MSRATRRQRFTLMEVLVAAVIFAGLSLALFAYASYATSAWQQLQLRRNQLDELLVIDRALDQILPHAIPFNWPDPNAETYTAIPVLVANPDSLRCAYLHRLNDLQEGAIRFSEIRLDDGNLVIQYSDRPFINWQDAGERIWTVTIAQNVQSLEFQYADWDSDVASDNWSDRILWTDAWDNVDVERYDLPLAVAVTVTFADGRRHAWLRRTMGNSFRERFGKWEAQDTP